MIECLRLLSGEDIIADVEARDGDYLVKNPIQVGMVQDQNGMRVMMAQFIPFAKDKKLVIPKSSVLFRFAPETDLHNEYSRITGGIVLASSMPSTEPPKLRLIE